ncbi:MAG TPA: DUF1643 domain-containing protein [Nevskiaceae bacterium]|nr:DUF1643 domain-containing protein [Nevskiaceae bacterium]
MTMPAATLPIFTSAALFSPDRVYRYTLWRDIDLATRDYVQFICLNPSTADETHDDPTVRRCIDYAKRWGYGALCMTNLFAFRATDPGVMLASKEPVGADNDLWLDRVASGANLVVAAWGVHGAHDGRAAAVAARIQGLHALRVTRGGQPGHPLYLPATLRPAPYAPPAVPHAPAVPVRAIRCGTPSRPPV